MAFELNIKNIGKLADEKIRIGQFTVFAGPNNTGKSFVSKMLYSLLNAMNANHAEVSINRLTNPIRRGLRSFIRQGPSDDEGSPLHSLAKEVAKLEALVTKLEALVAESPIGDVEALEAIMPDLISKVESMQGMLSDIRLLLKESSAEQEGRSTSSWAEEILIRTGDSVTMLQDALKEANVNIESFLALGIDQKIRENLIQNFQVPELSNLRGKGDAPSEIDIENLVKFKLSQGEKGEFSFAIPISRIRQLQQYSKVIYLESPVYWKMKNALESIRMHPRFRHSRREQISGIPEYFYDLASALKQQYTGDMAFPELYEKLTSEDVLGGKITISESGDLSFQEKGRSFSLPVTAMGITNIGILALLIERKVLDKESFIFIDEPEAHLHPAWQVFMAEALFELAKGGVNVVIATHSADILKWLDVYIKKNPEHEELVALNCFSPQGVVEVDSDFDTKLESIKQALTKPFSDLYIRGLL